MGLFDAIAGITGAATNVLNYQEQKKQNAWMRQAQETTWEREDNAVQRRAADMKAAGINPLLAAGSAAQASSPIQVGAPQMENTGFDKALVAMNLMAQKKNIALTTAQELKTLQEKKNAESMEKLIKRQEEVEMWKASETAARAGLLAQEKDINEYNFEKAKSRGIPTDSKGMPVDVLNALDAFKTRGPQVIKDIPLMAKEIALALYANGGVIGSALGGLFGKLGGRK